MLYLSSKLIFSSCIRRYTHMEEKQLIKKLSIIEKEFDSRKHKGNANVYLAG